MKLFIKEFDELNKEELYRIIKTRIDVFVVEQNCPYSELDNLDQDSIHLWYEEEGKIISYLRIVKQKKPVYIGRVLSLVRHKGYAGKLLEEAIRICKEELKENTIKVEAQVYAKSLYEKHGFIKSSDEFLEDGIPHIEMTLNL